MDASSNSAAAKASALSMFSGRRTRERLHHRDQAPKAEQSDFFRELIERAARARPSRRVQRLERRESEPVPALPSRPDPAGSTNNRW